MLFKSGFPWPRSAVDHWSHLLGSDGSAQFGLHCTTFVANLYDTNVSQVTYHRTISGSRSMRARAGCSSRCSRAAAFVANASMLWNLVFCTHQDFQEILCSGVVTNYPTGGVFVVLGGNLGFSAPTSAFATPRGVRKVLIALIAHIGSSPEI